MYNMPVCIHAYIVHLLDKAHHLLSGDALGRFAPLRADISPDQHSSDCFWAWLDLRNLLDNIKDGPEQYFRPIKGFYTDHAY